MTAHRVRFDNGAIWTGRPEAPWATCLVLRDGIVESVGNGSAPSGPAERVDLGGRAVLPGLVDAHVHLLPWARRLGGLDLRDAAGVADIQRRLREAEAGLGPADWLLAGGFHPDSLGGERAHRRFLDQVSSTRPIYVRTHDTHGAWANSEALRRAGVAVGTPDPPAGRFERDESGEPTGVLVESAKDAVRAVIPPMSAEAERLALARGLREANRLGLTAVHSFEGADERRRLAELREAGQLTLRVAQMVPYRELDECLAQGFRTGLGDDWLHVGCLKMFADGTLGLRTARMLAPYASGGTGQWDTPPERLRETAVRAARAGLGVAIHAIGDAGVRAALDAFEAVRAGGSGPGVPLRVEHAQVVSPEDVTRFASLNVAASMQPVHYVTDRLRAGLEWGDRCGLAYAWEPLRLAGAELLFGTDAPIEPIDPWANLAAALGWSGAQALPGGGGRRMRFAHAIEAMTRAPYRNLGREGGRLVPGAPADLIVVNREARELESGAGLAGIRVELAVVSGRQAHLEPGFPAPALSAPAAL